MRHMPTGVKAAKTTKGKVRCLGPGREHTFTSPDTMRVRVCRRCRARIAGEYMAVYGEILADPTR